jgi:aspartate kinase
LIRNIQYFSPILEKVFCVFRTLGANVQMISRGASKVNISLIVNDREAESGVKALYSTFFKEGDLLNIKSNTNGASCC